VSGNDFPDDDFYDGDDEPRMSRGKLIMAVLAVLIVIGFGTGIWYAYDQGVKKGVQLAPPIISADTSPVKEKPENPGGMDIPHQDKQVFGVLKSGEPDEKVEKLMSPPESATEDPTPEETADSSDATSTGTTSKSTESLLSESKDQVSEKAETAKETATETVKEVTESQPIQKVEEKVEEKTVVAAVPTPKPAPKATAPAASDGPRYRVQLGSFRSKDAAEKQWQNLRGKYKSLLDNLSYRVQDIAVEDKGTFHRLQAGAYENRSNAIKLCDSLKAKKQDCLVVSG
jgi:cell division protein FtsN